MKRFDIIVGGDNEYNITVGRHYIYNVDIIIQNLIPIIYAELTGSQDLIIDSSEAQAFIRMFLKISESLEAGISESSAFMNIYALANKIEAEISASDANLSIGRLRILYEMDDSILADFDENELEDVDFIMQ